jgi:hypothetical protein
MQLADHESRTMDDMLNDLGSAAVEKASNGDRRYDLGSAAVEKASNGDRRSPAANAGTSRKMGVHVNDRDLDAELQVTR